VGRGRLEGDGLGWLGKRMGEALDISGEAIRVEQVCVLLSRHSSSSSICIVSVFPSKWEVLSSNPGTAKKKKQKRRRRRSVATLCAYKCTYLYTQIHLLPPRFLVVACSVITELVLLNLSLFPGATRLYLVRKGCWDDIRGRFYP
jgi:hypothetical protein